MKQIVDIEKFLSSHNIPYVTAGKNVKKGNININCPFCSDDTSYHMGIDPTTGMYGCWRDSLHRGKNFARIIQALLHCSWHEALNLAGVASVLEEDEFLTLSKNLWNNVPVQEEDVKGVTVLSLRPEFKKIISTGLSERFYTYLRDVRKFDDVDNLIKKYGLYYCLTGDWKNRIIIPIYFEGKLVTWVGRSIYQEAELKYLDLSIENSVRHVKNCLYRFDELLAQGGKILFVTEGLFDCLKLDFYLPKGYNATCLSTKTMRTEQLYLLKALSKKFDEIRILLDADAQAEAIRITEELSFLKNVKYQQLFSGFKDPGEFGKKDVLRLVA